MPTFKLITNKEVIFYCSENIVRQIHSPDKGFFSGQQNLLSTLPWRLCQMFFLFKSYEYSKHISV